MSAEQIQPLDNILSETQALSPMLGAEGSRVSSIDSDSRVQIALENFRTANIAYGEFLLANYATMDTSSNNTITSREMLLSATTNAGFSLEALRKHVKQERLVSIAHVQDFIV